MSGNYYVYILASGTNGTLYVGVTNDLVRRVWEHRQGNAKSFASRYNVHRLVWFEVHTDIEAAIRREKAIKRWRRRFKLEAIESVNPDWEDLWPGLSGNE